MKEKSEYNKIYDVQASNVRGRKTVYVDSSNDNTDKKTTVIEDDDDDNAKIFIH